LGYNDIILASTVVMKQVEKQIVEGDPLDALNLRVEEEVNVDMYMDLQNIEDVEMSMNSSKRREVRKEKR